MADTVTVETGIFSTMGILLAPDISDMDKLRRRLIFLSILEMIIVIILTIMYATYLTGADQTFLVTILSLILVFDVFWLILHKKVTNPVLYGLFLAKQVVLVLLVGYATIVYTAFDWRNWSIIFLMVEVIYNAFLVRSYRKGIAEDNSYQEI